MKTDVFVKEANQAIYRKENEVHISNVWLKSQFRMLVTGVCPDLADKVNTYYNKDRIKIAAVK